MKVCAVLFAILLILTGCATKAYQAVGSLEELVSKEEIEKKQDWVKRGPGVVAGAGGGIAAVFLFGPAGLPAAAIIASLKDQEGLSMVELGDKTAAATSELEEYSSVVYADGPGSNYGIIGLSGDNADSGTGTRAVALLYFWDKEDVQRMYGEVMLVKKIDDTNYSAWRTPLLKKNDRGELVYAFDEKMKLKDAVTVAPDKTILFAVLIDGSGGQEVTRDAKAILAEADAHYQKSKYSLVPLRCAAGDKVCGEDKSKSEK